MASQSNDELTPEQLAALREYAAQHGRYWKNKLRSDWALGRDTQLLRQIRNQFGPTWLTKFKFKDE